MIVKDLKQSESTLQGVFGIEDDSCFYGFRISPEYIIQRSVRLQFKVVGALSRYSQGKIDSSGNNFYHHNIYVRFEKMRGDDDTHIVKLTSKKMGLTDKTICVSSNPGIWQLLCDAENSTHKSFDVIVTLLDSPIIGPFASLYDHTEMTDFELRGEDGSVQVHKFALMISSPVLRRMLQGSWKESTEGVVNVPGTTRIFLQQFKDYIYLGTLPSTQTELVHLLILSGYYMMPDLEIKCKDILMKSLTPQDVCEYLKLAGKHNLYVLMYAILDDIQCGNLKVDKDLFFQSKLGDEE